MVQSIKKVSNALSGDYSKKLFLKNAAETEVRGSIKILYINQWKTRLFQHLLPNENLKPKALPT